MNTDTSGSTNEIADDDLVRMAATAGFDKSQWRAMFYETGPCDITVPTATLQNFVRLILDRKQPPEPAPPVIQQPVRRWWNFWQQATARGEHE